MPATETRPENDTNPEIAILKGDPLALAVFGHWVETGEAATIKDIATLLGKSEGAPEGCSFTDVYRPVYESNYGSYKCDRRVDAWEPDRRTLRAVIVAQRQRCGGLDREAHPERYLEGRDLAESNCP